MQVEPLSLLTKAEFVDICRQIHEESDLSHLPFIRSKVESLASMCISNPDWFARVAIYDGEVVGAMCGYVTTLLYSHATMGVEEGIYVRHNVDMRGKIAKELLRQFVEWCRSKGVADIRTGVISNIDNYAADVFYRRNGFKRLGTIYSLKNPGDL